MKIFSRNAKSEEKMCELLGISTNKETDITFSFKILKEHSYRHFHGWGYAYYYDKKWEIIKEPIMAEKSEKAKEIVLNSQQFSGSMFISHIRFASVGGKQLENTHPFKRELFGEEWVFAHNGTLYKLKMLSDIKEGKLSALDSYYPEGASDSELAFCLIMEEWKRLGKNATGREKVKKLYQMANRLSKYGSFNFLLSNGEIMYAYKQGNPLHYVHRTPPYNEAIIGKSSELEVLMKPVDEEAIIIATVPLTQNEKWTLMESGRIYTISRGKIVL